MLTCRKRVSRGGAQQRNNHLTHVEVWHAGLLELVPQPARDDFDGNVVSDHPAGAGQGRLDRTGRRGPSQTQTQTGSGSGSIRHESGATCCQCSYY